AVGRDLAGVGATGGAGQGPLRREQQLRGLAHRRGAGGGRGASLPRARLRAEPLQPRRADGRARADPGVPGARDRRHPVEPARGRVARRRAREGRGGPPRERPHPAERRETACAAGRLREPLPRAGPRARGRRPRLAPPRAGGDGADHRSADHGAAHRRAPRAGPPAFPGRPHAARRDLARPGRRGARGVRLVAVLALASTTSPEWTARAVANLDEILVDHAHCEKKAASTAVSLLFRYPERAALLRPLAALAREELLHFEKVVSALATRGLALRRLVPSPYAERL